MLSLSTFSPYATQGAGFKVHSSMHRSHHRSLFIANVFKLISGAIAASAVGSIVGLAVVVLIIYWVHKTAGCCGSQSS